MSYDNYYQLLGVSPNVGQAELEAAFRREADRYNPSLNPGHDDRFQAILDAYTILSNPETRAEYDREHKISSGSGLRVVFKGKDKDKSKGKTPPPPEQPKTLTQLMDFDWNSVDEPTAAEKKQERKDLRDEVTFKVIIILAFVGLISLIWLLMR